MQGVNRAKSIREEKFIILVKYGLQYSCNLFKKEPSDNLFIIGETYPRKADMYFLPCFSVIFKIKDI